MSDGLGKASEMFVFIVSRDEPGLYHDIVQNFANEPVQIILDRRTGERRRRRAEPGAERRRADRRARPSIDEDLGILGWALVEGAKPAE